jgi:hypothetical protein
VGLVNQRESARAKNAGTSSASDGAPGRQCIATGTVVGA